MPVTSQRVQKRAPGKKIGAAATSAEPGLPPVVQGRMAGTLHSLIKPAGRVVLAALGPGLLLALWVHGHPRAGSATMSAPGSPAREAPPARWLASMEPLYPRAERPPLHKVCIAAEREPQYPKKTVQEFSDDTVEPDFFGGARVRERSHAGLPRELGQVKAALERRFYYLRQCYRWARYRDPALQGMIRLSAQIEPFGAWTAPHVTSEMPGGAPLADCVAAALTELRSDRATPRLTTAELRIRFVPSGQQRPRRPPARPVPSVQAATPRAACLFLPEALPTDQLVSQEPLLEVTDYDYPQAREDAALEFQQQLAAWRRGGQRGPRPVHVVVTDAGGYDMNIKPPVGRDKIRRSLRYNFGAYSACYAEALGRHPGLAGRVVLAIQVDDAGSLTVRVQSSEVNDAGVEECLRQAVAEVWIEPWEPGMGQVEVIYPLLLKVAPIAPAPVVPSHDTVAGIEARAAAQLQLGDGDGALRSYSALLRQLPAHPHRCLWHAGALVATRGMAPWVDERVMAAAEELVAVLARGGIAPSVRSECLQAVEFPLQELAREPLELGIRHHLMSLVALAVPRYQLLLKIGPDLPDVYILRYQLAEALFTEERYCEAAPVYAQVVLSDPLGRKTADAAYGAYLTGRICLKLDLD